MTYGSPMVFKREKMFKTFQKHILVLAVLAAGLSTGSAADKAERLAGKQVEGYLQGNTVYIDVLPGDGAFGKGGLSPFYYGHDGTFAADLPARKITGTWKLSADSSYCIDVVEAGRTFCTNVYKKGSGIEHHSVGLGRLMGSVVRIVPGNDADL